MEQQKRKEEASQVHQCSCESASKLNPTAAKVLREAITNRGDDEKGKEGESKEGSSADEVLVYARAVNHVDSSLE
ncbi:hypothetical protein FCM35_KLT17609 [Carex littledalei]|uniref:Uncharacterized protein n=1 Tax=Carex littledalei TaxID=544730 RepID=A0A833VGB7_9POAL|nr:hypothetical protein FCM35_KLT17609 [Carex littledalei]